MGKQEIENTCYDENWKKFTHTIGIPAMLGRLMNELELLGILIAYRQIL